MSQSEYPEPLASQTIKFYDYTSRSRNSKYGNIFLSLHTQKKDIAAVKM